MSWTEERIAALKRLWESGATASQIADELTGVSRNAVIGKAHRLGLKARPSPVKPNDKGKAAAPAVGAGAEQEREAPAPAPAAQIHASVDPLPAARKPAKQNSERSPSPAPWEADVEDQNNDAAAAFLAQADGDIPANADQSDDADDGADYEREGAPARSAAPRIVSVGPGGFLRQGPGDQQPPIPPAPPRRLVPAKPSAEIAGKTSLLDLNDKICRWPLGHPGEPDFHFCGAAVNPGFPYCVEHCGRAYQAQLPRGTRRPPPPLAFGGPRVR